MRASFHFSATMKMCSDKYRIKTINSLDLAKSPCRVSDIYFGNIKGLTVAMTQEQSPSLFIENNQQNVE